MCTRVQSTMNSFDDCYILLSTFHSFNHNNQSSMAGAECSCKYVMLHLSALIIQITYSRYLNPGVAVLQSAPRVVATLCRGGEESSQLGLVSPVSSMTSLISPLPVMAAGPH